ncbi:MAG: FAD-binding protein [Rhodobacteraceae bacterium]|nr:FAD-binding protein [Paracoccaceae bacterium]
MRPSSEAELADMVRVATGRLAICGGGTKAMQVAGQALSLSGLSGISHYEPEAMTLVAGAGTPMAEIEAALTEHNQRLAFEPADWGRLLGTSGTPTLGAVAAMNNAGPRRVQAGAARDHMLRVRYVDGAGQIIKNGGRVMKNDKRLCGPWKLSKCHLCRN